MISNSVTSEKHRRASGGQPRLSLGRVSISRQVAPICREDEDENDVEAVPPTPPPQPKVMKPTRRRSSINRTRETIVRLLRDQDNQKPLDARKTIADRILSPLDWLTDPGDNSIPPDEAIQELWQQKQECTHKPCPWYICLPNSKFRLTWDFFMAWLLSIMAFYIPFRVSFYWEEEVEAKSIFIFESCLDSIFALDIIFNFLTAYTDKATDIMITDPKLIAKRYLKGFFLIDLIATIPFGTILQASPMAIANKMGKLGRLPKMIRFAKAARLLKLLRVYKLHEYIQSIEVQYNVHHGISRMIKIVMLIMLVTHLVGCFWFLIGLSGGEGTLNGGWVFRYYLEDSHKATQYVASMYWAFSTLTTVGYGVSTILQMI